MRETAKRVLHLLQRVDNGYVLTEDEQQNLKKISVADFSEFGLERLPNSIGALSQLAVLDVSNNHLTCLPESIGKLSLLTVLHVANNELDTLPESIGNLTLLTVLHIANNELTTLPESIGALSRLTKLWAYKNRLTSLPENINKLLQLTELVVFGNQLINLPESIERLSQLTELNLLCNQLTSLPEGVGNLSQLTKLNVSQNQLTSLPESIGNLPQLTKLNVYHNQLAGLPESIGKLSQLTELDVSCNQLAGLPESIGKLSQLTELDVSYNRLTGFPRNMEKLSQLVTLYISALGLQKVPYWVRQLPQLGLLDLGHNPLNTLPDWLGDMTALHSLGLSSLRLTAIPRSLLKLNIPFFANRNVWTGNFPKGIYIKNVELSIQPVSLFDQSRDKSPEFQESRKLIKDYFATPKVPVREAKVIFLGDGKVGKTYTIQRLLHGCRKGDYPTKETHGILIEDLYAEKGGETYKIRVWDFGGQDIMHEMHRCFLTDRTCYVVMIDTRVDKQTSRARYWLRTVQNIAPNAPVLLLVNEVGGGKNRDLDYSSLEQEFSNLAGAEYCSSMDAGDEEFRRKVEQAIFRQALEMDSCKMEFPQSWENIRQNLLSLRNGAGAEQKGLYYIDRKTFHNLCDQYAVPADDGLRAWLLTWFNDLGVCFSYHLGEDGQERSIDYKILDPMWLTSAVYKIIWEKAQTEDGLITLSEIYRILGKPGSAAMKKDGIPCLENVSYSQQECGYVLDIMRMFRISYPADARTEFIPALCKSDSKMDPVPKCWKQHAAYRFRYTFLPETVLHRLMIFCFANLRPGRRWRKGFWLECEPQGLSAVIRAEGPDSEENELQIDVYAQSEEFESWMWLQPLCQQLATINSTLSLKTDIFVLAENDDEKKWFSLDSIWHWKNRGVPDLQGEKSLFPIQPLTDLIYRKYLPNVEKKLMGEPDSPRIMMTQAPLSQIVMAEVAKMTGLDLSKPFAEQTEQFFSAVMELKSSVEENTAAIRENTWTLEQSNMLLCAIRDGRVQLPPEVMDALANAFRQSDESALQAAGQKMESHSWKDKGQLLRDLLGDAANLVTAAPVLVKLGRDYGPALLNMIVAFSLA
jgi:small GTP-binding protein